MTDESKRITVLGMTNPILKNHTIDIANQMAESYGTSFVPATIRTDIHVKGRPGKLHRTEKGLSTDAELLELCEDMTRLGFSIEQTVGNHVFLWL